VIQVRSRNMGSKIPQFKLSMDAAAPPFGGCANPTFQVACDFPGMERIGVRERWQETFVNILDVRKSKRLQQKLRLMLNLRANEGAVFQTAQSCSVLQRTIESYLKRSSDAIFREFYAKSLNPDATNDGYLL